ncbi:amino acid ABC transporter permease [Sorangium cellulosum]|uniref:Amino acid ABC transporter permease n=1 Tax=Sorangium cellulosum TaxID=56 RepID=A0A2L0EN47_SORCE|nr:glycine betaine ABC transporter substrate-binding protein [Sorangium cellulosum]AUX40731.1 amino acid ABC transporter permease [Sorangium cellulosum]
MRAAGRALVPRPAWRALAPLLALVALVALAGSAAAAPIRVGSKRDTESVILGELCAALLRASGVEAVYRRDLSGGTQVLWRALQEGEIDLYPEYTGTLSRDLLKDERLTTAAALRPRLAPLGLGLGEPLGFDNSYGLGLREDHAREIGAARISDLKRHPDLRLGFSHEFLDRPEGFSGLRRRYDLPQNTPAGIEHELAYRAVAEGKVDVIDVYTTDAEIDYYRLRVLEDDLGYFPDYEAVLLHRASLPEPALAALRRLEGRVSREVMMRLNRRAKLDKEPEDQVAASFLREELGVASAGAAPADRPGDVARRTAEHLTLVAVSLFFAVLVALPLGVLAARRPRFGQGALGVLGVIQTIPSLALLVFLLPLLGIGATPAIVALFLYSLLPIVRGTTTGLAEIPPALRESAEALGLSPWAQLRRVELPLAARSILAGIKTAAVINVGTATLGALIGAGGYGQPILVGIRRDDIETILEGAIPAAALAILVQGLFELLERAVVPRGLRQPSGAPSSLP